jgi:lipid-binding SYLF domain-containing protein
MAIGLNSSRRSLVFRGCVAGGGLALGLAPGFALAEGGSARKIAVDAKDTLGKLYARSDKARELGKQARAILVFPKIVKAGLMIGGQEGQGALITGGTDEANGEATAFYEIFAGSFGLQAGAQTFSYALFFITASSLDYLKKSDGWAIGTGPSVVVIDEGMAKAFSTTTLTQDVYAIPFGQHGLMAGLGLEGSKITQIYPNP